MIVGHVRLARVGVMSLVLLQFCGGMIRAEDEKKADDSPRITAIAPLEVVSGASTTLRVRGLLLGEATELCVADAPSITVALKEKKKADVPNGMEAKKVGDTQVEAELKMPAGFSAETLRFCIVTPQGTTDWRELRVMHASEVSEEKEPNNGFVEAQTIEAGKVVRGIIKEDKDVDVFRFEGHRGAHLKAEVFAARGGSLLDPMITLFDAQGRLLASSDDEAESNRDARLEMLLPADGAYLVSVADANDRGSAWHAYTLNVKEVQP